jgi:hypothetical protein
MGDTNMDKIDQFGTVYNAPNKGDEDSPEEDD